METHLPTSVPFSILDPNRDAVEPFPFLFENHVTYVLMFSVQHQHNPPHKIMLAQYKTHKPTLAGASYLFSCVTSTISPLSDHFEPTEKAKMHAAHFTIFFIHRNSPSPNTPWHKPRPPSLPRIPHGIT